jgi:hypothetical protein
MRCPNCDSQLSCGCQKRKASDGKEVCTNCASFYEANISTNIHQPSQNQTSINNIQVKFTPIDKE